MASEMPVAQVISDATLEAAKQEDFSLLVSEALTDDEQEVASEPGQRELDLTSETIVAGSLFDQPDAELESEDEEDAEDVAELLAAPLRQPMIVTDDPSEVDERQQEEIQALLDERVRRRLRVRQLPKQRDADLGDREDASSAWPEVMAAARGRLATAALSPGTDVERTIQSVLKVLTERLSGGAARQLLKALPGLPALNTERDEAPAVFGFDEFLERVARDSEATLDTAHIVCQAVFVELRQRLPREAARQVASQLPADIFAVWETDAVGATSDRAARRAERPFPPPAELRISHPILQRIEREVKLPDDVTGAGAFVVAMCLLLLRIPGNGAARARDALPAPLQDLLFGCTQERLEPVTPFDKSEFLEAIGAELGVSQSHAEQIAQAVFLAVRECLPEREQTQIRAHLPNELQTLWSGIEGGMV